MTAAEEWIQSAGDTCRLVFWPLWHKDVCVYQLARVPPLRFQHKNGLQYKFLLSFPPPWRLWHWRGVQSAENLKTQAGILALCTTGYWEVSQHKLLWILCRIVAKSWHLAGSGLGQQAEFSQLLFKVTQWFCTLFCGLFIDSWTVCTPQYLFWACTTLLACSEINSEWHHFNAIERSVIFKKILFCE